MFGHVQANIQALSEDEKKRYRSAYCGLCRTLGKRHGFMARLALTYDLTFLTILLSSLYEPEETAGKCHCCVHPCRKQDYFTNSCTEYAADMTIALTYYKCLDDWNDDKSITKKWLASILEKPYLRVKEQWPEQCAVIERSLSELSAIENAQSTDPDAAANCFGKLMEGIFLYRKDNWEPYLRQLGNSLGRFIYLADAAIDLEHDRRKESYNPLLSVSATPQELRPILMTILGKASEAFEYLPLVQDTHLMKNILYSGIWAQYNRGTEKKKRLKE